MKKINLNTDLRNAILELERKQADEKKVLKEQFHTAYESIKPINVIKNTFKKVFELQDLKDDMLGVSVGLATGYLSKTLFVGASHSPFKRLLGTVLQFGITNIVAKNSEVIKSFGKGLLNLAHNIVIKDDRGKNGQIV